METYLQFSRIVLENNFTSTVLILNSHKSWSSIVKSPDVTYFHVWGILLELVTARQVALFHVTLFCLSLVSPSRFNTLIRGI